MKHAKETRLLDEVVIVGKYGEEIVLKLLLLNYSKKIVSSIKEWDDLIEKEF